MNEEERRRIFQDNKDVQTNFFLTPDNPLSNLIGNADYLNKNSLLTCLKHNPKFGLNEPEMQRMQYKSYAALNKKKFMKEKTIRVLAEYREVKQKDGSIIQQPIFRDVVILESIYPTTCVILETNIAHTNIISASRNGWITDKAITNKLVKEETVMDKTEVKSNWFSKKTNNSGEM